MERQKFTSAQLTKMALMIALVSISSYIVIPLPFTAIVITGQTLIINLLALVLTPGEAFFTMMCYWLLGMAGVPIFAGGTSGPGKMLGPAGGYYIGFIAAAVLISILKGKKYNFVRYMIVCVFVGMVTIYGIAWVWMKVASNMTWGAAFAAGVLPFLLLDTVKCVAAAAMAKPLQKVCNSVENMSYRPKRKHAER